MNRNPAIVCVALLAVACAGGAPIGPSPRDTVTTVYQAHAGSSRERVVFPGIEAWRELSGDNLVVRTRFNDYFLLTLEAACASDLTISSSTRIAIEQQMRNTLSRFDVARAGDSRCRIQYIREVDHRAVAQALTERGIDEAFIRSGRDR